MSDSSEPLLLKHVESLGHAVFRSGAFNLNVIGVRGPNRDQGGDPVDDLLYVIYRGVDGHWVTHCWPITTDPTAWWLTHPMRTVGTAILASGQYRGLWQEGLHRGRPALVQVGRCKVWRDSDRDEILELGWSPESGWFGINLHSGAGVRTSAGCQCPETQAEVDGILALVREQNRHGMGAKVTYTLIESPDPLEPWRDS